MGSTRPSLQPRQKIKELSMSRVLFITGDSDAVTPTRLSRDLFDVSNAPKDYWQVPGARHGDYIAVAPVEWSQRMIEFFALSGDS
jgi:hypothetical protein